MARQRRHRIRFFANTDCPDAAPGLQCSLKLLESVANAAVKGGRSLTNRLRKLFTNRSSTYQAFGLLSPTYEDLGDGPQTALPVSHFNG